MMIFEHFDIREMFSATMVLFAVIDIIGSIPIVVDLNKKFGKIDAAKAALAAGVLMISFLFIGNKMLSFLGVDINSFAIAGAFVIFIIAVEMILGIEIQKNAEANSASIVPIAFPLVAGAGTLTTTLSIRAEYHDINIAMGIIINIVIVYLVLRSAAYIERKMGEGTIQVFKKVFGIILLTISIKLFTANFAQLIHLYF
ncbi:MAG: MarC family protein [Bergeyella sp.]|nr:MarC family protein [Bergeyella sp.]